MTSETNLRFCYFLLTEGVEVSLSVYWCIARHQTAQYSSLEQYKGRLPFVYLNNGSSYLISLTVRNKPTPLHTRTIAPL